MYIYLYVKTHLKTGLKYLGKTTAADPHKYTGSGKYWLNHLKKHGKEYSTEILKECKSNEEVKYWGQYYSNLWDVVNSDAWANLKEETGDGGWVRGAWSTARALKTEEELQEICNKIRKSLTGKTYPLRPEKERAELRERLSAQRKGRPAHNKGKPMSEVEKEKRRKPKTEEHKQKIRESVLKTLSQKNNPAA